MSKKLHLFLLYCIKFYGLHSFKLSCFFVKVFIAFSQWNACWKTRRHGRDLEGDKLISTARKTLPWCGTIPVPSGISTFSRNVKCTHNMSASKSGLRHFWWTIFAYYNLYSFTKTAHLEHNGDCHNLCLLMNWSPKSTGRVLTSEPIITLHYRNVILPMLPRAN